jgi:GNAT superfamily N-acetyltransferase
MIEYIVATENDYQAINDFHNRLYQKNRTIEQFRWEFHDCPARTGIYIIAKDTEKNTVIGTQAVIPIELITDKGEIILSGKSEDTLVDPEYRGKRIFNNMYEMLFDECTKAGINYIWGFTTAKKPFRKMNFEIPWDQAQTLMVNKIIPAYKYFSSLNAKNSFKDKIKILALSYISKIKTLTVKKIKSINGYDIRNEKALDV